MTDIAMDNDRVATIGMDLGKRSFHLIGMDARGKVIMRQQLSRGRFERAYGQPPAVSVGVEACAGAHHIGRRLSAFGHNIRLIPRTVREALPQRAKERLPRRRGHRRGGAAADDAIRADQERGAARSSSAASDLQQARRSSNCGHQPASRLPSRVWRYRAARTCKVARDTAFGVGATHRCALPAHDSPYTWCTCPARIAIGHSGEFRLIFITPGASARAANASKTASTNREKSMRHLLATTSALTLALLVGGQAVAQQPPAQPLIDANRGRRDEIANRDGPTAFFQSVECHHSAGREEQRLNRQRHSLSDVGIDRSLNRWRSKNAEPR